MATITVRNASELSAALSNANGGETILLANGNYGSLSVTKDFSSMVTIQAINPQGATFSGIGVKGGSNIHIDGVKVSGGASIENNAHHVTFSNSELQSGLYMRNVDNVVVHNNDIGNSHNVLTMNDVTNFTVTENYIHHATADLVRITGASKFGLFENNTLFDVAAHRPEHPDMLQMFGTSAGTPSDIVFRGNHMYDDPSTGTVHAQGFFFGNPGAFGFKNLLVEQNLINVGSPNSIYVNGGISNVVVRENTLIPWPGDGGAIIRLAERSGMGNAGTQVIDNVAKEILNETGDVRVVGNYEYGRNANLNQLFSGNGDTWQDFIPPNGSPISLSSGLGATDRLQELINGATPGPVPENGGGGSPSPDVVPQPDPAPTPQPDPEPVPQPTPTPTVLEDAVFYLEGAHTFSGRTGDVIEYAHDPVLALSSATVALTFTADTVSGLQGLISKDAAYFNGGGNHFTAYIENGALKLRFQDGESSETITINGIRAGTEYDLQFSFGDGQVAVWLDGTKVGEAAFNTSWASNAEHLQIGGNGWASATGEAGFAYPFDGTISDVVIVEGVVNPAVIASILNGTSQPAPLPDPQPDPLPEPDPQPQPQPDPAPLTLEDAALHLAGPQKITLSTDVIEVAPSDAFALETATVALTFNADSLTGFHGLLSKDARYYSGDGNHFTAYLEGNSLIVRFQDGSSSKVFEISGIRTGVDYDLQVGFGDGNVYAMLNGTVFGEAAFDTTWATSPEYLQVGANGWGSASGKAGFTHVFNGTISDVLVIEGTHSYDAVQTMLSGAPSPTPQPEPADVPVFFLTGPHDIESGADVLEYAHDPALELASATMMLTFTANSVDGGHGLLSKDAAYYAGGGHHFTSYIEDGTLFIRFQDGSKSQVFKTDGIQAGVEYDLQISFGEGEVSAILNGSVFGRAAFDMSWETNTEHLQVGANGWGSSTGQAGFNQVFDGTISDVILVEGQKSPADMEALKSLYATTTQHNVSDVTELLLSINSGFAGAEFPSPAREPASLTLDELDSEVELLAGGALAPEHDYFTS